MTIARRTRMRTGDSTPHASRGHSADAIALGTLLRGARKDRGLTLEQVSSETKIPCHVLAELERDTAPHGERGFYQRARIRAYARSVGLAEGIVRGEFEREPAPSPSLVSLQEKRVTSALWRDERVVILIVCAAISVWVGHAAWRSVAVGSDRDRAATAPSVDRPTEQAVQAAIGRTTGQPVPSSGEGGDIKPMKTAAVSLVASAPAPEATALVIATEPPGARVTVDGIGWGVTPLTIRHLSPGAKRLRVTKEGYSAAERSVSVVTERSSYVHVELPTAP
jgi:cytoskeletal protein RodZ